MILDTHVWIWLLQSPERISERALSLIEESGVLFLSAVSVWEASIKQGLGRLELPLPLPAVVNDARDRGLMQMDVSCKHAVAVSALPPIHRDPFDRLLVAQAVVEEIPIITNDPAVTAYEVETIW